MSKNQKRLRYNNCVHIGNFKLQLYQKAVWDEQKGTVLNLQYIIVQPVNEHFSVEIYEHSSMFHYLKELINDDNVNGFDKYVEMLCRNILFVSTSVDSYFHNIVSLFESVSLCPLLLKEGYAISKEASNAKIKEAITEVCRKWLESYEKEVEEEKKKSEEYSEEDAKADAAADTCEEEAAK